MATPSDPDFRARLNALSDKYGAGVPATIAAISAAVSLCCNADADADALKKLHELLHGVAGSAATFGYGVLGAEARRIEQELRPLLGKCPVEIDSWPALTAMIAQYIKWAENDPKATEFRA